MFYKRCGFALGSLILPGRVRTRREIVAKTAGPKATGSVARAVQQCAVAKRPGNDTPGGVVSASRVVPASTTRVKHGTAALGGLPKRLIRLTVSSYLGIWRCHLEKTALFTRPVTTPRRLCTCRVMPA